MDEYAVNEKVDKRVTKTVSLFDKFANSNREEWIQSVYDDYNFRLGNQWTETQVKEMEAKGQPPVAINRIHPAVEMAKAMLTSNRPAFRVSPREDSDVQVAQALNGILQYVWQISDADMVHSDIVDDMLSKAVGYWRVYIDPQSDMGRGDVKIERVPVEDVYVDPNSRDKFFRDASDIIISRKYTKGLLKELYPEFNKAIKNATGVERDDLITVETSNQNRVFFPDEEDVDTCEDDGEYVRYYERYTKEFVKRFAIHEDFSGIEHLLTDEEYKEYINRPAWNINGKIYTDPLQVKQITEQLLIDYNQKLDNLKLAEEAVNQGQMTEEQYAQLASSLPQFNPPVQLSFNQLIQAGLIQTVEITTKRVKMICVAGDKLLFERILNCEDFPIIPYCNIHTGTPYPLSDVRIVKDKQKLLNKFNSIIVTHASLSTNSKMIVNRGSVNVQDLEKRWSIPGSIHEMDLSQGDIPPVIVQPLPIPNELFALDNVYKNDIDHEFGIYESMMGNAQQSPTTYRATIAIDEFGQRKLRNKMQVIETGLTLLGRVVLAFAQELYTSEKIIRLLQPNNSLTEYAINKRIYDTYSNEVLSVVNDISRVKYDVIVVANSTLPSNRYSQLEFYMEAYKMGIIDKVELLKKTEVFDMEGVLQRTDEIQQLQSALQQAQEEIKKLSGDLQTAQRQTVNANIRAINSDYKAKQQGVILEGQKQNELMTARASDTLNNIQQTANVALKEEKMKMQSASKTDKNKNK